MSTILYCVRVGDADEPLRDSDGRCLFDEGFWGVYTTMDGATKAVKDARKLVETNKDFCDLMMMDADMLNTSIMTVELDSDIEKVMLSCMQRHKQYEENRAAKANK
jgi:uncharacterized protein with von Willebrand factor type A (vWA) domain